MPEASRFRPARWSKRSSHVLDKCRVGADWNERHQIEAQLKSFDLATPRRVKAHRLSASPDKGLMHG